MRAMRHHFYLELTCQNCFAHSGLVYRAPSTHFVLLWTATYNCPNKQTYEKYLAITFIRYLNKNKRKAINRM